MEDNSVNVSKEHSSGQAVESPQPPQQGVPHRCVREAGHEPQHDPEDFEGHEGCTFPVSTTEAGEKDSSEIAGEGVPEPPERIFLPADTDADTWNVLAKNPSRNWRTDRPAENIEYVRARAYSPSVDEQNSEDKNSGEPKPTAPSHSSVVIPKDNSLEADPNNQRVAFAMTPLGETYPTADEIDAYHDFARLRNAFLMAYDLAGIDAEPLPERLPENYYVPGYMDKVRELREVFALCTEQPPTSGVFNNPERDLHSPASPSESVSSSDISSTLAEIKQREQLWNIARDIGADSMKAELIKRVPQVAEKILISVVDLAVKKRGDFDRIVVSTAIAEIITTELEAVELPEDKKMKPKVDEAKNSSGQAVESPHSAQQRSVVRYKRLPQETTAVSFNLMLTAQQKQEAHARYVEICNQDVSWYRRFGQYRDRIRRDSEGTEYVIGDWSWNRLYPHLLERVDSAMPSAEIGATHNVTANTWERSS